MEMNGIETPTLTGAALDYAVAVASGQKNPQPGLDGGCVVSHGHTLHRFCPSTEWAHGGPLLDKFAVSVTPLSDAQWRAEEFITHETALGDEYLVATMRCIVMAELGQIVKVPEQLCRRDST
ncbi:phage protein NinX family protein [Chromobacterium haemolyticum]|uniref:phage protein NinX family protein n=1 Tax=Chromobacterium haemolyticum TaxID=394935 RepID=UPI001374A845|nr:phage protein NinX family protein [Chromobacterium haemolyticum]